MRREIKVLYRVLIVLSLNVMVTTHAMCQSNLKIGATAPEIHIDKWLLNKPKDKSTIDRFIILDFWATWCHPCLKNVGHINDLHAHFKHRDLLFLHMTNESAKIAKSVFDKVNFQTPVVTDKNNKTSANFGDGINDLAYYPFVVMIDDKNIVRWFGSSKKLNVQMIESLLNHENINVTQMNLDGPYSIAHDPETYINKEFGLQLWSDLWHDPNITFTTYIEEVSVPKKKIMNAKTATGAIFSNQSLQYILNQLYPKTDFSIPKSIAEKKYNFFFIDQALHADSKANLIGEMADQLNLHFIKETNKGFISELFVTDTDLLIEPSHQGRAQLVHEDNILKMSSTLANLASTLSLRSNIFFHTKIKSPKTFEFVINLSSYDSIKESLKCYGITLKEQTQQIEAYTFHIK